MNGKLCRSCPRCWFSRRWSTRRARQKANTWSALDCLVNGRLKRWRALLRDAKIASSSEATASYSFRKTCCCDLLQSGVPTHEVQALMGHADIKTTLTWYTKINKTDAERRIRAALAGPSPA